MKTKTENCLSYMLMAFALASYISIAAGNIFLGLVCAVFLAYAYQAKSGLCADSYFQGYYKAIGGFIAVMLLSALASGHIGKGLKTFADLWIWRLLPFVAVTLVLREHSSKVRKILYCSMAAFFVGTLNVIYQGYGGAHRADSFFGHPMTFAGWLCIMMPMLLIMFFDKKILGKYNWLAGVVFFTGTGALIFNGTRGAWLGVMAICLLIMLIYSCRSKKIAAFSLVFVIAVGACFHSSPYLMNRWKSVANVRSNQERLLIWNSAYNMFLDHPVLGVGLGQYKDNYQQKYISPKAKEPYLSHAHSNVMQMLAENGALGLLAFLGMLGYMVLRNFADWWRTRNPYALITITSISALFIQGLTEYNFGNSAVMKAFWLVLACVLVLRRNEKE